MKSKIMSFCSSLGRFRLSNGINALGVALIFLFSASVAEASHYRYGSISYKFVPVPPGAPGACAIEVTVNQAWRLSSGQGSGISVVGDTATSSHTTLILGSSFAGPTISSVPIYLVASSINAADDWFFGTFKHTFVLPSASVEHFLYFGTCCRIGALKNNSSGSFRSECKVSSCVSGNESPVTALPPIVKLGKGLAGASFAIPAADPDGDPISFRLATSSETVGTSAAGFSVSPSGTATYSTVGKVSGDLYNVMVAIEDPMGAKTIVDFIIEIVDSASVVSTPPMFDFLVTPLPAPCIELKVGEAHCFMVKAWDADSGDVVDITAVGVPLGAITSPGNPSAGGNPDSMMVCWTPGPGDVGAHVITFTAEDSKALTTATSVCITVKADTASGDTCVAGLLELVTDSTWMMSTTTTPSTHSGTWTGVAGVLPGAGTFTVPATVGQPYPWPSIHAVTGAEVLKTTNNITYFRKEFDLLSGSEVARLRLNVDDMAEIYINGVLVAGEYGMPKDGWKNDPHAVNYDGLSVDEPYLPPNVFDYLIAPPLSMFSAGTNEVIVVVRNLKRGGDKGGFSFSMEVEHGCASDSVCVSDTSWRKSTVVTPSNQSGTWTGTGGVPADGTFTLPVAIGQPYPYPSIDTVPGSQVINSESNNITYYKKTFDISTATDLDADFWMTFDDAVEVYLNGVVLFRENTTSPSNWVFPAHTQSFAGGMAGAGGFDYVTAADLDTVFMPGTNCIVVALRNFKKAGDRGGFSFKMHLTKGGSPVITKEGEANFVLTDGLEKIVVFPNPTNGDISLVIPNEQQEARDVEISLFGLNGELLTTEVVRTDSGQYTHEMSLNGYANGLYFVRIKTDGAYYSQKVLKQ